MALSNVNVEPTVVNESVILDSKSWPLEQNRLDPQNVPIEFKKALWSEILNYKNSNIESKILMTNSIKRWQNNINGSNNKIMIMKEYFDKYQDNIPAFKN